MQWMMLQKDSPKDYVIATGEQISVRDFTKKAADFLNIPLTWEGHGVDERGINDDGNVIVRVDPLYFRPAEVETLLGDITLAKKELNWKPTISIDQLIEEMIQGDMKLAEKEKILNTI